MPQRLQRILVTGVLIGFVGLLSMATMILSECSRFSLHCLSTDSRLLFPAFAGAMIAGMMFYSLWGRNGRKGWGVAALAAVLCTAIGATIGFVVLALIAGWPPGANDPMMLFLGPWVVVTMYGEHPALILIWLGGMSAAHLAVRQIFQKHTKA